jgi:bifunctional non-homologous end joining protein LigD
MIAAATTTGSRVPGISTADLSAGPSLCVTRLGRRDAAFFVDPAMLLTVQPPRGSRFGSPLVLLRVHWVRPEMVVEVSYVEWTPDGLLRHVVYLGEREDKPAADVRRDSPHAE